jgi:DNA-binding Xre family transcriptional regulator
MKVPLIVKKLGQEQGHNITSLAKKSELSVDAVRLYWRGDLERIDWSTLVKLSKALGVKPKDLIADEEVTHDE